MWKKLLAAPVLGLMFIMFLPAIGFVLVAAELGKRALDGVTNAADRLYRWAELG